MSEIYRGPDKSTDCANCPCATNGQPSKPIRGAGSLRSLAIIGEGPSTEELSQGYPFVGESGKLLQKVLNDAGIDRQSIWITNALLCQRPNSKEKLDVALACCTPRLQHELSLVAPKAICALGQSANRALHLPVVTITDSRGTLQTSPLYPNVPVVSAIHPAAILRGGAGEIKGGGKQKMNVDAQMIFLQSDVAKAYKLATEEVTQWADNITLITDPSQTIDVGNFVNEAFQNRLVGIDLEWNKQKEITWLGLATQERAISLYWPHMQFAIFELMQHFGADETIAKLFHNLQADIGVWEAQIGPIRGPVEDTMLMHHAAYPGAAHDLQQVTSQFLMVPPWKANRGMEEKAASKQATVMRRLEKKALKKIEHEARNAASAAEAKTRKTKRKAAHDERNTTAYFLKLLEDK